MMLTEKEKAHRKIYREGHKEERKVYMDSWRNKNQDKILSYAENHRVKKRERERTRRKELRTECITHYGGKCACCGEKRYEFLAIDHINGGGSKMRKGIRKGGNSFYLWIIKNSFPTDLRILCHNCNLSLGFYGYCPHKKEG
jgi:predicted restriction endonuclease